jgi:hypothetical protein
MNYSFFSHFFIFKTVIELLNREYIKKTFKNPLFRISLKYGRGADIRLQGRKKNRPKNMKIDLKIRV